MKKIVPILLLLCIYASTYAQPANDEPCGATALTTTTATTLPTTCTPTTVLTWTGATNSVTTPLPNCGNWSTSKKDVWYKITVVAGVDSILINTSAGTGATPTTDAVMILYSATACDGTFTQLACVDDVLGSSMPLIKTAIPNAGVYYIRICDYSLSANGNINICVNLKQQHPTIDPTKRVGIGTANPEYNLDVNGTTKVRSDLTIDNITKTKDIVVTNNVKIMSGNPAEGKVLTSDAAGNATWQEKSSNGGVGFGSWGDCSMNNVSEYNPVVDSTIEIGDNFGYSVSISGMYAIVGARLDDNQINGDNKGSVSFYKFNGSNWTFMQKIIDINSEGQDVFGHSVSIFGNYAIIGSPNDEESLGPAQGSVSIYKLNNGIWSLAQKLFDETGAENDNFGISVSMSDNYAVVGSSGDDGILGVNQGSTSIYKIQNGVWTLMQKITDATGSAGDSFGGCVSISGTNVIIGSSNDDILTNFDQGSASFYQFNGSIWVFKQKITLLTQSANGNFGSSVAISGNLAIVGAEQDNGGTGSASIYELKNGLWVFIQRLIDATSPYSTKFGCSVSISGEVAIVGAKDSDGPSNVNIDKQGATFIFKRIGVEWQKMQLVVDPFGTQNNYFGNSVGIDSYNKRFIIGAYGNFNSRGKVVFGKLNL